LLDPSQVHLTYIRYTQQRHNLHSLGHELDSD
jgi:hypothetical protein